MGRENGIRYHHLMSSKAASRTLTVVTLIVSAACFASICLYLSAHRMMWADEFDAWNLLADPSWRHAFQSLKRGADGGPPLYYAIGRCIFAVTGLHPVVMRLYSALCFWLAAVLWAQMLRRYFTGVFAVAAVGLAFLCNPEFIDQIAQMRFYGQLLLAVAIAVYVALWLEDAQPRPLVCFAAAAAAGAFLVAAHPLGLIYSAAILFAQLFGRLPSRARVAAVAGTVLSWSALLITLPELRAGAETTNWLSMPRFSAVIHFYDNSPTLLPHRYLSVAINLTLLCLIVYAAICFLRRSRSDGLEQSSLRLLLFIAGLFMLMPIGFYILSHVYKPLFLGRYLMPYALGFATFVAAGIWQVTRNFPRRSSVILAFVLLASIALIVITTFRAQTLRPVSELDPLLQLEQSTSIPTVLQHDGIVRQAHFYAPSRANNLFYLMLMPKPGEHSTLDSIAEQGYEPYLVFDGPFFRQHRQFLYVEGAGWPKVYQEDIVGNPQWTSRQVTTVTILGRTYPVLKFTRVGAPSSALPGAH